MIIQSERVWVANNFNPLQLEIENNKIVSIYPYGEKKVDFDFGKSRILPGFIDVHTHGAYGFDTNDDDPQGLRTWAERLPLDEGVTSFLPTTITQTFEVMSAASRNIVKVVEEGYKGANILGIHYEGPYLNKAYKGAHTEELIVNADVEQFKKFQEESKGLIKYITVAPENDKDFELIKYASTHGVVVSLGHSAASYQQAVLAVANGAKSMTHVHNAMTPYKHRGIGLVGAALRMRDIYGEIICDGYHVDPEALNNFFTTKGRDYSVMITDALRAKGLPKGDYTSGGLDITINDNGTATLKGTTTLAGSTLQMNKGLKNIIENALVDVATAINSVTINPARLLRVDDHKGKLATGYDADIVVLDDNYDVESVFVSGEKLK